ncbi:MAG: SpoIIE family protein phosphatase [Candidatus Omnitrophica bacterium]|nr:SpoIIE family protein phosphatase [Candidatus Omnitrophota bacterium]
MKHNSAQLIEEAKNEFFTAVAKAITSIKNINELIDRIVHIICTLMQVEKCSIQLLNEETGGWHILGADEDRKRAIKNLSIVSDNPMSKWVREKGEPLLVKDFAGDERFKDCFKDGKKYKTNSFLLVPLKRENEVIGIISTTDKKSGEAFNETDLELLSTLAIQVVFAIETIRLSDRVAYAKVLQKELKIAQVVQHDLLPKILPKVAGVSFSAKISSAEMVAGDFYDVIFIDKDHIAIVVGDVEGKGIAAALLMVRVLTLIRSEVFQDHSPSHILTKLNTVIGWGASSGLYVTVFYGVIDIYSRRLVYSSAGHEFPILYRGAVDKISEFTAGDPFLGSFIGLDYEQAEVQLKTGDRLVIFTDGAVEIQNKEGKMLGRDVFKKIIKENAHLSSEELTQRLYDVILQWKGEESQTDDIIILTVGIDDPVKPEKMVKMKIKARLDLIKESTDETKKLAKEVGFKDEDVFDIGYATAEAVENCIKHAKAEDDTIAVSLLFGEDPNIAGQKDFIIIVQDEGRGFKVEEMISHSTEDFDKATTDHGRGLLFIHSLMDEINIKSKEGQGTEMRLVKILN